MEEFEQRSATGRVRIIRSSHAHDPRSYAVLLDGAECLVTRSLDKARAMFRELASQNDPPRPVETTGDNAARDLLMEQAVAQFYAERGATGREKGGRSRRK